MEENVKCIVQGCERTATSTVIVRLRKGQRIGPDMVMGIDSEHEVPICELCGKVFALATQES